MISPLTSLRFLFALMVFGAHIYTIDPYFDHLFYKEGFVGVNFFFILSGFIIAYTYRDRLLEQKSTLREFWVARIARIYPLHLLTLGISVCVGGYISGDLIDWIKHFVANLFLLQPFIPAADYFFSFNSPSWSLGCEQLFYFLFPFIIGCLGKKNRILYLAGVLVIAIPIAMYFTMDQDIKAIWYVNPLTRLPDFLIGMLLFHLYDKFKQKEWTYKQASVYETAVVLLFLLFYLPAGEYIPKVFRYSCYYWLPISLLLYVFAHQKGYISRLLSNKYLVIGGEISFSFYLIHLFIIEGYNWIIRSYDLHIPYQLGIPVILIIVTGLSLLSYYYFEKPANKLVKNLLNKKK